MLSQYLKQRDFVAVQGIVILIAIIVAVLLSIFAGVLLGSSPDISADGSTACWS